MISIFVGDVLQPRDEKAPIQALSRVVDIAGDLGQVALADISKSKRKCLPKVISKDVLEMAIQQGTVGKTTCALPRMMLREDAAVPDGQKLARDTLYKSIQALVKPEILPRLLYTADRGVLIRTHAKEFRLTPAAIYQRLERYFRYGSVQNAFLPINPATRAKLGPKNTGKVARGRKKRRWVDGRWVTYESKLLTKDDYENFEWARDAYVKKGKSVKTAHDKLIALRYNDGYEDGPDGPEPIIRSLDQTPSIDQFRYWLKTKNDFVDIGRSRMGQKEWDKDNRPVLGSSTAETYGAGHRFQTDTTELSNGSLVSSFDRSVLIGPPIIMLVVDVASEFVTGLHIAVDNPKYNVARIAIHNTVVDKVEFCARYGITISPEEWPADFMARTVSIDRGELFTNDGKEGMVSGLDIWLDVHQSRFPVLHGLIESRFGIAKGMIYERTPGFARRASAGRGAPSPIAGACLTLDELTAIVIRLVLHYNKTHKVNDLRTLQRIAAGVVPTPINLCLFSLKHENGKPYRPDPALVEAHLLPKITASVERDGIHVNGLRYASQKALAKRWFERARNGIFTVQAGYDPEDPRLVVVFDEKGDYFDHGTLIDPYARYAVKRLCDILGYMKHEKTVADAQELLRVSDLGRTDSHIDRIIKHARALTNEATGGRGHRRGKVSGEAREAERIRQKFGLTGRNSLGTTGQRNTNTGTPAAASQDAYTSAMALILNASKERK